MAKVHDFLVLPAMPEQLKDLEFIAKNMHWVWNSDLEKIFKRIDSKLFRACGNNPIKLLSMVSQDRMNQLAENQGFICEYQRAVDKLNGYLNGATWFDKACPKDQAPTIAYFSAEFGIHESLPLYAGGLGMLAGDHLKSASDLGLPLVAVGLLYQKGYFRQYLNIDGWQQEVYIENDFYRMPIELVRDEKGQPLTITVDFPKKPVTAQIWCVSVGRVKLYLLDTNVPTNTAEYRMITSSLYGGDREMRIKQEIILGIGGFRALVAMGLEPTVCHMNEGHAAFMALERIRYLQQTKGLNFNEALEATKAGSVFTVHTPVKAGLDEFPLELVEKYFQQFYPQLGIDKEQFLAMGKFNPSDANETFKMPVLALRLSAYHNGVSKLHGQVSRRMWSAIWPGLPEREVPVISITNGVHLKSWLSEQMNELFETYISPNWDQETANKDVWNNVDLIPDAELWRTHQRNKEHLIAFARQRLKSQIQRRGTYHTELNWAEEVLDPEALTIGFARRFATYKRGNLIFKDPKRLVKLLNDPKRPIQIIFAGKAHPRDSEGKEIIRQIIHFASNYNLRRRIVFLEDYDSNVARILVRGVDVWLNNPRRPLEASGTSGMKAAANGALNLSTLDGWWCEGYDPERGWAVGAGEENYEDPAYQDMIESQAIYNILENEVVPLFYTRTADNLPRGWIHRMKNAIKYIAPQFSTWRMVGEYTRRFYNHAGARWRYLTENDMTRIKNLAEWKQNIKNAWAELEIKKVDIQICDDGKKKMLDTTQAQLKVGYKLNVRTLLNLGRIKPDDISVEVYHGPVDAWGDIKAGSILQLNLKQEEKDQEGFWFEGTLPCKSSGRQGLAVRVLPKHPDMVDPYEPGMILWESTPTQGVLSAR
ncbi:MAG: alpha-glucan family phosphorylase [Planctomycetota bacterium]|jgi:starch phosphorylase